MTFISKIVQDIDEENLNELINKCYIFPTRRACAFFRFELQNRFKDKIFFAPKILSIQDCATHITNMYVADDLHLLLELFKIYIPITNDQNHNGDDLTFDIFYPWGQMLLKDFDEIDKYLVDAKKLYSTLFEIREMELDFNLNQEMVEIIERFRDVMSAEQKTDLQEKFLRVWEKSYQVYNEFKQLLKQKQIAYEGMIYAEWNNLLQDLENEMPYDEFIFCGFNALSKVEESIIENLIKRKKGKIYWDADTTFLNEKKFEAGMFMRKYQNRFPESATSRWIITENQVFKSNKYNFAEVQGDIGQARLMGSILNENKYKGRETAIIVCNENLLFPTLYGIPEHIEKLNVTMGYPIKLTPLFALTQSLFDIQLNARGSKNSLSYKYTSIANLFENTYFKSLTNEDGIALLEKIKKEKLSWVTNKIIFEFIKNDWLQSLFIPSENTLEILSKLEQLLFNLFGEISISDEDIEETIETENTVSIEQEMVYHFIKHLKLFRSRIEQYEFDFELKHLKKIFLESLMGLKIPFSGEPLEGVQLMGFLESRVLDFENVIISALNENNIPANSKNNSFIPFAVRVYYGLPTYIEQDAIYAYHFFRLLQRAKNVYFITDALNGDAGEASRFYLQLKTYLTTRQHAFNYKIYTNNITPTSNPNLLEVRKTAEVLEKLSAYESHKNEKQFSASALSLYINCPIQFYFKYIAELKAIKPFKDEIENVDLGNVVHNCLENIYKPYAKQILNEPIFKQLVNKQLVKKEVESELRNQFYITDNKELEGKNLMLRNVIERLVFNVLKKDAEQVPFAVLSTEEYFNHNLKLSNGKTVKLFGKIDRIDLKDNIYTVVDYKTGAVNLKEKLEKLFEKPDRKTEFQVCFYAYLLHKTHPTYQIKAGIYALKELSNGIKFLNKGKVLDNAFFENFETELIELIEEMMDENTPFTQTSEPNRYTYSDFKEIVANT